MHGFQIVTLMCLLALTRNSAAKYVEGQINDPVQVTTAIVQVLRLSFNTFLTAMGFPCSVLLLVNGRNVFL